MNALLGCASFSWPHIPTSLDAITWLKVYGHMGLVVVQGTVMASAIAVVEELLFRSWLPQEIEVDLGYHQGIIISGLAFSFLQRFVFFSGIKTFVYCINKLHLVNRYGLIHSSHMVTLPNLL